ncbi:MAG: MATE family efflux transporter, partial [Oscillospiraceae bacterium]|nr:MATE family efflux transporter [Oscillospiraceae bacterium]
MHNIFSTKYMLKPDSVYGETPSTKEAYGTLIRMALPSVAEMVLSSLIGSVDTMMVGSISAASIAAVGLTGQPRMLILSIFFALNVGLTAVVARRKGEGRREDAQATLKNAVVIIFFLSIILTVFAIIFARPLMLFAGAIEGETLELSETYFRIITMGAPLNALTMAINAAQRGIGNTKTTMYVN